MSKSIETQTCLSCQHEIKDAVKDIVEELALNVENQFLDDAFDRESLYSNTSKSEYETEYDTEYKPDSSFQLRQWTCLSDDQFLGEEHSSNLPSNNLAFIVYWSSLVLLLQSIVYFALRKLLSTVLLQAFALVEELICGDGHISLWRSQPRTINCYEGNTVLAASIFS